MKKKAAINSEFFLHPIGQNPFQSRLSKLSNTFLTNNKKNSFLTNKNPPHLGRVGPGGRTSQNFPPPRLLATSDPPEAGHAKNAQTHTRTRTHAHNARAHRMYVAVRAVGCYSFLLTAGSSRFRDDDSEPYQD